jgi:arylsulfatase
MGDAFFRWDGFSYYVSFSEFLPSVALVFILWSSVALLTSIPVWLAFRLFHWLCRCSNWKINFEHLLSYAVIFILSGVLVWTGKKNLWPDVQTTIQVKSTVFFCLALLSMFVTYTIRNRAERWTIIMQERITPLVWLFGILFILSFPLVAYKVWHEKTDEAVSTISEMTSQKGVNNPNIILVTFDALAARHMSAYGYQRETTPFISRWSKDATMFTMAEADSNFTTPAVASLMTGKRVWTHQTYHIEGSKPIRGNVESLPYVLKNYGYFNIALVVNPFASVRILGMSDSFDIAPIATEFSTSASLFGWKFGIVDKMLYRAFGEKIKFHNWILSNEFILSRVLNLISKNVTQTEVPPDKVFDRFLDIIDDNQQKPFFAWIHVFPPHDPYLPPETYMKRFNPSLELRTYKRQEKLVEESYKYLFQYRRYPEEMQPAVDLMRDYYDEFIKYLDEKFENFIRDLNKRQIGNTIIILSADHGDSFEHGYFTHGGPFLYEQVTHIPLIIKEPGKNTGQVISDLVGQIDIPATILDLANIPGPSWMEGRSLLPLMRGKQLPNRPVFTMNFQENRSLGHKITKGSIAVREGDYKLIHYLEKNESLLFNLKNDPDELHNIIEKDPEKYHHMLSLIIDNLEPVNNKMNN